MLQILEDSKVPTTGTQQHCRFYVEGGKALRGETDTEQVDPGKQLHSSDQGQAGSGQPASLGTPRCRSRCRSRWQPADFRAGGSSQAPAKPQNSMFQVAEALVV